MEKEEWKPFRNALDKSGRKKFDEMSKSLLNAKALSEKHQYLAFVTREESSISAQ